jgi:hypothetical protein
VTAIAEARNRMFTLVQQGRRAVQTLLFLAYACNSSTTDDMGKSLQTKRSHSS